jgi:hypothetical protein
MCGAHLDQASEASFQSLYASVNRMVARTDAEPPSLRLARDHSQRLVTRDQLAGALARYYGQDDAEGSWYRARVGDTDLHCLCWWSP